jgi:hypothetical protein
VVSGPLSVNGMADGSKSEGYQRFERVLRKRNDRTNRARRDDRTT